MPHTGPVKPQVVGLIAGLLVVGCGSPIEGTATTRDPSVDPAFFFAGDVPVYGQTVSKRDTVALSYLRAMRRIDVCGLADQQTLSSIGDVTSTSTLYALDECDIEVKLPGKADRRYLTVSLELARATKTPSFRAGDVRVYETAPGSCEYLVPLDLSGLPGARPLRKPYQPYLRLAQIGNQDCAVTQQFAAAVAVKVGTAPLPARDAAAVYPVGLAERDPCEVLSVIGDEVDSWDVNRSRPYSCEFGVWRDGDPEVVGLRLSLQPKIVDLATEGSEQRVTPGGQELYLDTTFCSATVFVGPAMQRRLAGGDFVDVENVVVRPAVTVDGGEGDCSAAVDVAGAAAELFG